MTNDKGLLQIKKSEKNGQTIEMGNLHKTTNV